MPRRRARSASQGLSRGTASGPALAGVEGIDAVSCEGTICDASCCTTRGNGGDRWVISLRGRRCIERTAPWPGYPHITVRWARARLMPVGLSLVGTA